MSGTIDLDEVKKTINDRAGEKLAYNLNQEDPTEVEYWISTGSQLLDATVCKGMMGGIPSGKIIELAGQESTGKSFLSSLIAANAQRDKDVNLVVYFDSEHAQDSDFMELAGVDLDNLLYVQAKSVEFVFETIEEIVGDYNNVLFVWDSIAMTGLRDKKEGGFGERQDVASKARVMADAFDRITIPLGNTNSTLICTNQLRDYIPKASDPHTKKFTQPYYTPGGRTLNHVYSLRIWLKRRDAKNAGVFDENGEKIGAEVKVHLKKSRFGSEDKEVLMDIIWADGVGIREVPYWKDILKEHGHPNMVFSGAWWKTKSMDKKVQGKWSETLRENDEIRDEIKQYVKEALVEGGDE